MKKLLSMVLVLTLTLSMVLSGCGSKDETGDTDTGTKTTNTDTKKTDTEEGTTSDVSTTEKLTFPLEEQVTLTAFVHTRPNTDNFDENAMTKYIEERTNINLEFVVATSNEAQEQLNLLLATGDYPDIIITSQLGAAQQALYGAQGTLIPLNDLIEKYGDNTKKVFDEVPVAKERSTMPDGNIYNLPTVTECYHCYSTQKMWIYQPWLDKLGLDMPETTEEFQAVLTAFATQDPNGNGKADEIALAGAQKAWEGDPEAFIMNAFVYNATNQSGAQRLFVDNDQIVASYTQDGWKEGVKYLQALRQDGLLAEESFTQGTEGLKQMGENPDDVILGAFPGGALGVGLNMSGERWRDYVSVPALEGPDGVRFAKYDPYSAIRPAYSITDVCENPEVAFMLADLLYDQDISFMNSKGVMDVDWKWIDDDSKLGINGEKALWNELIPLADQETNNKWDQMGNYYESSKLRLGRYQEDPNNIEVVLYKATKANYEPYWPSTDMLLPPLTLTEDQSAELLTLSTSINDYVAEKLAEYVLTDVNVDEVWDGYITELESMGINEMLAVYQEAYDAK